MWRKLFMKNVAIIRYILILCSMITSILIIKDLNLSNDRNKINDWNNKAEVTVVPVVSQVDKKEINLDSEKVEELSLKTNNDLKLQNKKEQIEEKAIDINLIIIIGLSLIILKNYIFRNDRKIVN